MKKYLPILTLLLFFYIFFSPYIGQDKYFLIGFDMGHYINEINRYTQDIPSLKYFISRNHEPGFFLFTKTYFNITWETPLPDLKILLCLLMVLKVAILWLIWKIIFWKKGGDILLIIVFWLCVVDINIFYMGLARQYFSDIIGLLIFYLCLRNKKYSLNYHVIAWILLGFLLISHKGVSFVVGLFLLGQIAFWIIKGYGKKNIIYFLIATLLACLPFMTMVIKEYTRIVTIISTNMVKTAVASKSSWAVWISIYYWRQIQPGESIYTIFYSDYTLLLSLIILTAYIFSGVKKKEFYMLFSLVFLINIVESRGEFSQRILYYLFLAYFILFVYVVNGKVKKQILMIFVFLYIINGVDIIMKQKAALNNQVEIEWLKEILQDISKEDSLFIVYNWPAMILAQMGYHTLPTVKWDIENYQYVYREESYIFGEFLVNGSDEPLILPYNIPLTKYKDIYVIILPTLNNKFNEYGLVTSKTWDVSKYYQKMDKFCSDKIKVFCNTYKYTWHWN